MAGNESRAIAACVALLLAGCGGAEAPQATGAPMSAAAPEAARSVNEPPLIESVTLEPASPRAGDQVTARVRASDPEGDPLHLYYRWRLDGRSVDGGASLHVDAVPKGALVEVEVVARDAAGESAPATATARVANRPPVLLGVVIEPLGVVTRDQDVVAVPRARDPDGDELEFEFRWWVNGQPSEEEGATLPSERFQRGDRIELEVVASDGSERSEPLRSQPFEVENAPPRITSQPGGFTADGSFQYRLSAEDADGDSALLWRLIEGPRGMQLDGSSQLVSWRPAPQQAGEHPVVLEVRDRLGGTSRQEFSLRLDFGAVPAAPAP